VKSGDLIMFPCAIAGKYHYRIGILLNYRDNPADTRAWEAYKKHGSRVPGYCKHGPRQIVDVMYEGRVLTCWASSVSEVTDENR
jgi:hypothetical protein